MGTILLIAILSGATYLVYKAITGGFDKPATKGQTNKRQGANAKQVVRPTQKTYRPQQTMRTTQNAQRARQGARVAQSSARPQQSQQKKKSKYNLPSAY